MEALFSKELGEQISELYQRMEKAYDQIAQQLSFSCEGCSDNCCDSYFQHHTYVEWAYLWQGLNALDQGKRQRIIDRGHDCMLETEKVLAHEGRPQIMCPLNEEGLCGLYGHRLMICRMHGVPSMIKMPNGMKKQFPGCFRCQELTTEDNAHVVDRTPFYQELVVLENEFLGYRRNYLPRLKMTLAEMIVKGPPEFK